MLTLTPVQFVLIILALEIVSAPIIIFCMTAAILTWWTKKKEYDVDRENRLLHIVNSSLDSFLTGVKEGTMTKNKEAANNEH